MRSSLQFVTRTPTTHSAVCKRYSHHNTSQNVAGTIITHPAVCNRYAHHISCSLVLLSLSPLTLLSLILSRSPLLSGLLSSSLALSPASFSLLSSFQHTRGYIVIRKYQFSSQFTTGTLSYVPQRQTRHSTSAGRFGAAIRGCVAAAVVDDDAVSAGGKMAAGISS